MSALARREWYGTVAALRTTWRERNRIDESLKKCKKRLEEQRAAQKEAHKKYTDAVCNSTLREVSDGLPARLEWEETLAALRETWRERSRLVERRKKCQKQLQARRAALKEAHEKYIDTC